MLLRFAFAFLVLLPVVAHAQDAQDAQGERDVQDAQSAHEHIDAIGITYLQALGLARGGHEASGLRTARDRLVRASSDANALADDLQIATEAGVQALPVTAFQGRIGTLQPLSTAALGDARRAALSARANDRSNEAARVALERRIEASRAWLMLWTAERSLELLADEVRTASRAEALARRGLELAELSRADVLDATSYREQLALMILDVDGERTAAEHALARALESTGHAWVAEGELPALEDPSPGLRALLVAEIANDPALRAIEARALAFRAQAHEARAQNATRIGVGGIVDRTTPNGIAFLFNGTLTLPTSGRGEREGAVLDAEADVAESLRAAEQARRGVDYASVVHELEHAAATSAQLEDRLGPALELELLEEQRRFDAGESTMLEVLRTRRASLGVRLRRIAARAELAIARSHFHLLARAIGVQP